VIRRGPEDAGVAGERSAPGRGQHRPGDRATAAADQRGRGDPLGHAVEREDVEPGDAVVAAEAGGEGAANEHAGEVAGDDDGDGCERVVGLACGDR
jgi:hypothetical protein